MNEPERLQSFYPFDDDVLDRVERAARRQENLSWPEYVRRFNITDPFVFRPLDGKPIELVDFGPRDAENVLVYHQPMGCALDSNIMCHVATLAAALPERRIIAEGNPGLPGKGYGKLSFRQASQVWSGHSRPVVAPVLEYLESQSIEQAEYAGESYGADKAAASAEQSYYYDVNASRSIMVEPVSVIKSGLIKIGSIFLSTNKHSNRYLQPVRQRSQSFASAEGQKDSLLGYAAGLARLSNLAIAKALGRQGFERRVSWGLAGNPGLKAGLAWGTASEFDPDNERRQIADRLARSYNQGQDRVFVMPLEGQTHAMNQDIFLNAAIIAQLLKKLA